MVIKCPYCGYNNLVDRKAYDNPLVVCQSCKVEFLSNLIKEPVLFPKEKTKYIPQWAFISFIGIAFFLTIMLLIYSGDEPLWTVTLSMMFIGLLALFGDYRRYRVRENEYETALLESQKRLNNADYRNRIKRYYKDDISVQKIIESIERNSQDNIITDGLYTNSRATVYCRYCGKSITEDSTFCRHCGKRIK